MLPTPRLPSPIRLAFPERSARATGFGGSLRRSCPKTSPTSRMLCPVGFDTRLTSRFGSVRIVRRHSSLRPVSLEPPEGASNSAVAPLKPPARTSCASHASPKLPEGISSTALASPTPARKRLRMSLRSTRLARRPSSLSGPVVGPGAILRRVSAAPAPAASQSLRAEALPPCVDCLGSFRSCRLTGATSGSPLQSHVRLPEGSRPCLEMPVMRRPIVTLARFNRLCGGPTSHPETTTVTLRPSRKFEDQVLEQSSDFSVGRLVLDVMMLSLIPSRAKR